MTSTPARQVEVAALKLVDVAARGGFVLTATFGLPLSEAGQFGMIALMVSLFAFAFNFERQIDIQRRAVGEAPGVLDRMITEALKFSAFNWGVMLPLFLVGVAGLAHVGWQMLALATVVVIGEQLSNQGYYYALIDRRYRAMLAVVAAKNCLLIALVLWQAFGGPGLRLSFVLTFWAATAVVSVAAKAILFHRLRTPEPRSARFDLATDVLSQHRASLTHFLIGLVAVLMMQYDRLVVGALMSLENVGVYFRHQVLIALAYQFFSVISVGRVLPTIFAMAKHESNRFLFNRLRKEYLVILSLVLVGYSALWALDAVTSGTYTAPYELNLWLIGVMLTGFLVRMAADLLGLILNARMRERVVLRLQLMAFVIGGPLLLAFTYQFGMWGTAIAALATSLLYLVPTASAVYRLKQ